MMYISVQKASVHDQEMHNHRLQPNPRQREEEPQNTNSLRTPGRQPNQNKQLSLPRQDDCKNQKEHKVMHNKTRTKHRTQT